jgi:hypothetical protein
MVPHGLLYHVVATLLVGVGKPEPSPKPGDPARGDALPEQIWTPRRLSST